MERKYPQENNEIMVTWNGDADSPVTAAEVQKSNLT